MGLCAFSLFCYCSIRAQSYIVADTATERLRRSVCVLDCLSVRLSVGLSVCLSVVSPSASPSVGQSVCPSVFPSVSSVAHADNSYHRNGFSATQAAVPSTRETHCCSCQMRCQIRTCPTCCCTEAALAFKYWLLVSVCCPSVAEVLHECGLYSTT